MLPMRIVVFLLVISTTLVTACFFNCKSSEEVGDKCCDQDCRCGYFEQCTNCNTCVKRWDYTEKYKCQKDPCRSPCAQTINVCGDGNQICLQQVPPYHPYPPPYPPYQRPQQDGPSNQWGPKPRTFEDIRP